MLAKFVLHSCCRTSLSSLEIAIKSFFIEKVISSEVNSFALVALWVPISDSISTKTLLNAAIFIALIQVGPNVSLVRPVQWKILVTEIIMRKIIMKVRKIINSHRVDSYRFHTPIICQGYHYSKWGHIYFPLLPLVCHAFDCVLVTCMGDTQWVKWTPYMQT